MIQIKLSIRIFFYSNMISLVTTCSDEHENALVIVLQ